AVPAHRAGEHVRDRAGPGAHLPAVVPVPHDRRRQPPGGDRVEVPLQAGELRGGRHAPVVERVLGWWCHDAGTSCRRVSEPWSITATWSATRTATSRSCS